MFPVKYSVAVVLVIAGIIGSCSRGGAPISKSLQQPATINNSEKMKIEIWTDVMCPWCYIGKRRFEKALSQFKHKDKIEVEWKSFQLNPSMRTDTSKTTAQYLAESKGWSPGQTKQIFENVTQLAKAEGLQYDFDKTVVANSFDAHRLLQLAKRYGKGDAVEELLFKAYFEEGKNIADYTALIEIGQKAGLNKEEVKQVLHSDAFKEDVKKDAQEANNLGCTGVPFFVINRKYGISGAQDSGTFLKALEKAFAEWEGK